LKLLSLMAITIAMLSRPARGARIETLLTGLTAENTAVAPRTGRAD